MRQRAVTPNIKMIVTQTWEIARAACRTEAGYTRLRTAVKTCFLFSIMSITQLCDETMYLE